MSRATIAPDRRAEVAADGGPGPRKRARLPGALGGGHEAVGRDRPAVRVVPAGQRLDADLVGFNSIDALKQWIAKATDIPPESQVLLTPRGKHVKLQALLTEVGHFSQLLSYKS